MTAASSLSKKTALTGISRACFAEMQSKTSLALTAPYHAEELRILEKTLKDYEAKGVKFDHLIAVGSAHVRYMDVALRHGVSYTAVDPNIHDHLSPDKAVFIKQVNGVSFIAKGFAEVEKSDLPEGKKLFLFLFNVFPYIDGALEAQKKLAEKGDVMIVSSWNRHNPAARNLQKVYYRHLHETFNYNATPNKTSDYIDALEQTCRQLSKSQSRVHGKITDILTVKL